jgi:hypothetical protein
LKIAGENTALKAVMDLTMLTRGFTEADDLSA